MTSPTPCWQNILEHGLKFHSGNSFATLSQILEMVGEAPWPWGPQMLYVPLSKQQLHLLTEEVHGCSWCPFSTIV